MGRTNENKDEAIKLGYKFTEKQQILGELSITN